MINDQQSTQVQALGLEFIELSAPDIQALEADLTRLGFAAIARHRHKPVVLYRQGDINLIVNESPSGTPNQLARQYGVTVCALGILVDNAQQAFQTLQTKGAWPSETSAGVMELNIPAIEGIGGSQIFLIDRVPNRPTIYDVDFQPLPQHALPANYLGAVTGLTLKVVEGRQQEWEDFFQQLFGFNKQSDGSLLCAAQGWKIDISADTLAADDNIGAEHVCAIRFSGEGLPESVQQDDSGKVMLQSQQSALEWYWEQSQ
ncbi:VOC family protein [Oceanobacter kriegii]|uniref:hypothetical protein n=1 Tax=Oceanobacter kriegii TaxID=64972 RepID=UPI0003F88273|nr:hypothetical protein [Oceanobacter kriegii]